jgi:hypothetical protein
MIRKKTLFLLLLFSATSLLAEVNFGLNLGLRDEDDEDHTFGVFGLTGDFGPASWIVRPEVGLFTDFDVLDNEVEIEESVGIVHSWRRPRYRINLGGGFASVPSQSPFVDESAQGGYIHAGMEYVREEGSAFGLDLRYVNAEELEDPGGPIVPGGPVSVDYVQLSFVIHWHFKGPKSP